MYRDAMIQTLVDRNMDVDRQAYKPALSFLTEHIMGYKFFYEKSGDGIVEGKYGLEDDKIDLIELASNEVSGSELITTI